MFIAAMCVVAPAEVLTVGTRGSQFQTIQEAIAAAHPDDVVRVNAATYTGQIVIDKRITLEGVGKPVLRGDGKGSVVIVTAEGCTIRGLIIEHSGRDLQAEDSGLLLKSSRNLVEDNELRDVLYGIYLFHSRNNTIRRNRIEGRKELDVGSRGGGFHIWNSPENIIEDNTVSYARDGMYIQSSPGNNIRRNRVFRTRYGLHYMNSDGNKFEDNVFSDNVAGAAIMYSRRIELRRNVFIHNRGFSSFGILFQDCEDNVAENNYIIDNATGIFAEALRRTTFRLNVIAENDLAMQIFGNSTDNLFTENNFVENLSPLLVVGKRTDTRWSENGRGNFWSDYSGYDLDGNGIGDVKHKVQDVFQYLEGNYPRLRLYLSSPAAQSLAAAEHNFPVIKSSPEEDRAPLMNPIVHQIPIDESDCSERSRLVVLVISIAVALVGGGAMWKERPR